MIVAAAAGGGCPSASRPGGELPAPPDPFVVTTAGGVRASGPAARVEIRYFDPEGAPEIEVAVAAADGSGRTWAARALAPLEFLQTRTLTAELVDGLLEPGTASVQVAVPGGDAAFAPSGTLELRLREGELVGEVTAAGEEFSARLAGPFVVTCAAPAASLGTQAPAPVSEDALPALVVDERFESALCKPHARLGPQRDQ